MPSDRILIAEYDPSWPARFLEEAGQLRHLLGSAALRIDHVGSTAVPGLAAKPVIDIQVSVESLEPRMAYDELLAIRGYVHVALGEIDGRYPFFQRPAMWPTSYHLHLCVAGSPEERNHLAFRDYLRDHADIARRYETLKRRLAATAGTGLEDRERYSEAKTPFITDVVRRAVAEGYPRETGGSCNDSADG